MDSRRQCRLGPNSERSAPTSINVADEDEATACCRDPLPPPQGRSKRTNGGDRSPAKVRSLEAALARDGSEACEGTAQSPSQDGSGHQDCCSPRAGFLRLEKAITALGDFDGVEVENLKAALKRAQKEAQEVPVAAQIREREAFIERAKKRIARIDEERQAEVRSLEEAENKLNQLRALRIPQQEQPLSSVPDSSAEVCRGCKQSCPSCKDSSSSQPQVPIQSDRGCEKTLSRILSRRCNNGCSTANRTCRKPPWPSDLGRWSSISQLMAQGRPRMERR